MAKQTRLSDRTKEHLLQVLGDKTRVDFATADGNLFEKLVYSWNMYMHNVISKQNNQYYVHEIQLQNTIEM